MPNEGQEVPKGARRPTWKWLLIALGVVAVGLLMFSGGVYVWEYTNSTAFCGTVCHTMPPEYTAYLTSPHARVACVDCHLGQENILYAFPRKVAEVRHLADVLTARYETPIYVRNLRPARFTCEQCHFPEKFSTDRVREIQHYAEDVGNTEIITWLMMKTGGGSQREGLGKGIHWHIENEVWYLATDPLRQQIPYVRQVDADGKVTEYFDVESGISPEFVNQDSENLRRMDCIDCHNRISHQFQSPDHIIDQALARYQIDRDTPDIKEMGIKLFSVQYASHDEAAQAFEELDSWYQTNYPDYYAENQAKIRQAIDKLKEGYRTSVFPDMNVGWQAHPDNVGHSQFPGCFRCHDGKHVSADNTTIRLECNICHTIPEVYEAGDRAPVINIQKLNEPASHRDTNWLAQHRFQFDTTCMNCHTVDNPGGSDNSSFCSNSACHATEWKFVGLDAPKIRELSAPPKVPSTGVPNPVPHPIGSRTDCTVCHGPEKVRPWPENHAGFTPDMCTTCHQPTLEETAPEPAVQPGGTGTPPAIPHELAGRDNCLLCHDPAGNVKPAPQDHVGRTAETCQACHKPKA